MKKTLNISGILAAIIISFVFFNSCTNLQEARLAALRNQPHVPQCPPGQHWDYQHGGCVPDDPACAPGFHWIPSVGCVPDCPLGYHNDPKTGDCIADDIVKYYHNIPVTFTNGMLKFNDTGALNNVLAYLESDYETWNNNYENQYPNFTADQLDSLDDVKGFDEFKTVRDFENLFGAQFQSSRSRIEVQEITWCDNNFAATSDPDNIDYTFDDFLNAILNNNNQFKIGNDTYQFTDTALLKNGINVERAFNPNAQPSNVNLAIPGICVTYRRKTPPGGSILTPDNQVRLKMKVAIHGILPLGGVVKSKIVSYKYKSGKWRPRRTVLSAAWQGNIYVLSCNLAYPNTLATKGPKSKKRIWAKKWYNTLAGEPWEPFIATKNGEITASFVCNNYGYILPLTW